MVLRDAIDVHAPPVRLFEFFDGMSQARYVAWHPDHKVFRWTQGQGLAAGNRFHFEEVIAGKLLRKTVELTRVEPGSHIEFAPVFWPMRLLLPRLVFRAEPVAPDRFRFVAEIFLRVGPLGARLNRREFDAVREHMRIEGLNFKRFAEQGGVTVARLDASHAATYRDLMLEAYVQAADAFTSTAEERAAQPLAWWVDRIASPAGRSEAFGAFVDGRLVGSVALEYSVKPKTRHAALLLGMYVRPAARGGGVGRALLDAAIAAARERPGVDSLTLTVTEGNHAAIGLYAAAGFVAWGTEPRAILTPSGHRGKVHMTMRLARPPGSL